MAVTGKEFLMGCSSNAHRKEIHRDRWRNPDKQRDRAELGRRLQAFAKETRTGQSWKHSHLHLTAEGGV